MPLDPTTILVPAHRYALAGGQTLQFLQKERDPAVPAPALRTIADGTTNEELIEVLIDRTEGLNRANPCAENERALDGLRDALWFFNKRTASRQAQGAEGTARRHESR